MSTYLYVVRDATDRIHIAEQKICKMETKDEQPHNHTDQMIVLLYL